jgi:hypothetical protein
MGNRTEATVETPEFLATAESYWVGIKKKGDDVVYVPVRRIDFICQASGRWFRFPLTARGGVASFGDNRESALRLKTRYSFAEMRTELARMVGVENADRLLAVFEPYRIPRIDRLLGLNGNQAA